MRLLIIESDSEFREFLARRLEERCFAVDAASDGQYGLALGLSRAYDVVILGHALPGMDGYRICAELRKAGRHVPIVMTSKDADVFRKVDGFATGIDDYLVRPFYVEELAARLNALLSRPPRRESRTLSFEDLTLDTDEQRVRRGKVSIYLTRKEFALLEYFPRTDPRACLEPERRSFFEHHRDAYHESPEEDRRPEEEAAHPQRARPRLQARRQALNSEEFLYISLISDSRLRHMSFGFP